MRTTLLLAFGIAFPCLAFDHTHATWDKFLKQYVTVKDSISTVNYKGAKSDRKGLDQYLTTVEAVTPADYGKFTDPQKLAFLINAYNAFTVKLILDNYPVKSIKDLGGTFSSPWKKKFFKFFGEESHLDNIEHDHIRKEFNEPRIHFAVVCASKGCPALWNEAFTPEKMETQLERNARAFLKDSQRNRFNVEKNRFEVSKIFDWYGKDFEKKFGSVQNFLAPRMGKTPAEETKMKEAKIDHTDYDWTLNETGGGSAS